MLLKSKQYAIINPMKKYDLYLFDFDGTLFDTLQSLVLVFKESFAAIGVEVKEEDCLLYTRQPLEVTYESLDAPMEKADIFVSEIRRLLNDERVLKLTRLYPDTIELLEKMRWMGMRFAIVTSNNEKHIIDVLKQFEISPSLFEIIVDSDQVPETKPSPRPILYALEKLHFNGDKSSVVYVGDGLNDMLSAKNAGVSGILVDRINAFNDSDEYIRINNLLELLNF